MELTIYGLDERYNSSIAYFQVQEGNYRFISPIYPDAEACKEAIDALIKELRTAGDSSEQFLVELQDQHYLVLFKGAKLAFNGRQPTFESQQDARDVLARLQQAAQQTDFDLPTYHLKEETEWTRPADWFHPQRAYPCITDCPNVDRLPYDKDSGETIHFVFRDDTGQALFRSQAYPSEDVRDAEIVELIRQLAQNDDAEKLNDLAREWLLVFAPRLNWERTHFEVFPVIVPNKALRSLPASLMPCDPIFKLFSPYDRGEFDLFFGRERDAEELFEQLSAHPLILLYGTARVGKTSLVQCGLAKKIDNAGWFTVQVQRGADGILPALQEELRQHLTQDDIPPDTEDPIELLHLLYEQHSKPVYLIFDQLETLFDASVEEAERESFFRFLNTLQFIDAFTCRTILVARESHLAQLADYERFLPTLLKNRYHLRSLTKGEMVQAIVRLLEAMQILQKLIVKEPDKVAKTISEKLADPKGKVPFHCAQIYLHEVHQAVCRNSDRVLPTISPEAIEKIDPPEQVVEQFVARRVANLQSQLSSNGANSDQLVLEEIDELVDSKKECGCKESKSTYAAVAPLVVANQPPNHWLRRLLLFCLLALIGAVLFAAWMSRSLARSQDPCYQAKQEDSSEAYLNYLCEYGDDAPCAEEFQTLLDARNPVVWTDYLRARNVNTCAAYQDFLASYGDSDVCGKGIRSLLKQRGCPFAPRDTVTLTMRDTIIETRTVDRPNEFNTRQVSPPCQNFTGTTFKRVGPLWMMTEPLNNGRAYTWEEALNACAARGYRLPCVGEIEFLVGRLYNGNEQQAFRDLTAPSGCPVINVNDYRTGKVGFWTGTESNDFQAWSFYFDLDRQTVEVNPSTPKSATIPCLCVKTNEQEEMAAELPPCYTKRIGG